MRRLNPSVALAAFTLAIAPSLVAAQGAPASAGVSLPAPRSGVLSIQPISAMFTLYAGEYEHRLSPKLTLGVGGTYVSHGADADAGGIDTRYSSGDVKLRYYPGAAAFQGFSLGVQGGYTRITGAITNDATGESREGSASGPTFGVALDYNWLLGASRSFYVGLGVGAKALFVDAEKFNDAAARYPTARISIGRAF